jgi:hypothetical protein
MSGLAHFDFLLSCLYDDFLAPEHLADLRKSGITDETIRLQKIRSVAPHMIDQLLGFRTTPGITSSYVIPFADPTGGWMPHIRLKVFPALTTKKKGTIKYLGPRRSGPRLFFPVATLAAVIGSDAPVWCAEGAKKALALAQLGLPVVGFEGIEGWHQRGSSALLADFAHLRLQGRTVELVVDGDVHTNPNVARGARRFADALRAAGALPRLVRLTEAA